MDIDFAGRDGNQSGQRFLDGSAPRLKRHAASCEAAGGDDAPLVRDSYPQPAGKDEKPSREFEGGALNGREAPVPYLACRSTEQSKQEFEAKKGLECLPEGAESKCAEAAPPTSPFGPLPNGRHRLCGAWTLQGTKPEGAAAPARGPVSGAIAPGKRFVRLRCKCWSCSHCGPRRAIQYRCQFLRVIQQYKLHRFITLTLDVRTFASGVELETFLRHFNEREAEGTACTCETCSALKVKSLKHIRTSWNKLRYYMLREFGTAPRFVSVIEFQKRRGMAHLHVVIDRWIPQAWLEESWQALGGGMHVDIRHIDMHRAAAYLSKYLSKDVFLSAPAGMRRVTTSRSIKLNPKKHSEYDWQLLKTPIQRLYVLYLAVAQETVHVDGEVDSFAVRE